MEQVRGRLGRYALGIGVGLLLVSVFFFVFSWGVFLKSSVLWWSLLIAAVVLSVTWTCMYWSSTTRSPNWATYVVGLVFIVGPFTLSSGISSMRVAHLFLPKEERVVSFTAARLVKYVGSQYKGCVYFSELSEAFTKSNCGYSRYFLAMINEGDVFSVRAVVSSVGYQLIEVVEVKREGSLVYRRKGY